MTTDTTATVDEALAYADGYKAALDDCERTDVAKLIEERDVLSARLSFERAFRSHHERVADERAAEIVALTSHASALARRLAEEMRESAAKFVEARAAMCEKSAIKCRERNDPNSGELDDWAALELRTTAAGVRQIEAAHLLRTHDRGADAGTAHRTANHRGETKYGPRAY